MAEESKAVERSTRSPANTEPQGPKSQQAAPRTVQQGMPGLYARCVQGKHSRTTKYGPCGIITAVCLFPIGLICLFIDTKDVCSVCGVVLE